MPIYEFRCSKCGKRFEKLCALGETGSSLHCPSCGEDKPARVMSGFATKGVEKGGSPGCGPCSSNSCSTCGH
jgi:putative FmdB family regulatory protein